MINLLNFIFVNFVFVIVILGTLINKVESLLPVIIRQTFRYGKYSVKESRNQLVAKLEVPKSWFKHFYSFAILWSSLGLCIALTVCFGTGTAPWFVVEFLDIIAGGKDRKAEVDVVSAALASFLLFLQCSRRYYETHYVQVFSSHSTINLSHYFVGYFHYFGVVAATMANTYGFTHEIHEALGQNWTLPSYKIIFALLFVYCWYAQYDSNVILANLRKNKSGQVTTEKHLLPKGGYFHYLSSPHMFFEVVMYICLTGIMPTSVTMWWILAWVITNQTANALLVHKWYIENFKDYPKSRKAMLPCIL